MEHIGIDLGARHSHLVVLSEAGKTLLRQKLACGGECPCNPVDVDADVVIDSAVDVSATVLAGSGSVSESESESESDTVTVTVTATTTVSPAVVRQATYPGKTRSGTRPRPIA